MEALILAFHLILVHGPDGQEVSVNVDNISSVRKPRPDTESHFARGAHCLIFMSNGHFIGSVETCEQVIELINEQQ